MLLTSGLNVMVRSYTFECPHKHHRAHAFNHGRGQHGNLRGTIYYHVWFICHNSSVESHATNHTSLGPDINASISCLVRDPLIQSVRMLIAVKWQWRHWKKYESPIFLDAGVVGECVEWEIVLGAYGTEESNVEALVRFVGTNSCLDSCSIPSRSCLWQSVTFVPRINKNTWEKNYW